MSDFARMLKEAAGEPPRPLNMVAICHRAARLGLRRRAGVWFMAILGLAGIGVPAGLAVVSAGDRTATVEAVDVDRDNLRKPDGGSDGAMPVAGGKGAPSAREHNLNVAAGRAPTPPTARPLTPAPTTSMPATGEGCVAEGYETGTALGGFGNWPQCSYQASSPGGYRADPNTEFEITITGPDGYRRVIEGGCAPARPNCKAKHSAPSCGPIGTIRSGDYVEVRILNTVEDGSGRVSVGPNSNC